MFTKLLDTVDLGPPKTEGQAWRDLYIGVGAIAVQWSDVEAELDRLIAVCYMIRPDDNPLARLLLFNVGYNSKVYALQSYAWISENVEMKIISQKIKEILKECQELYPKRNYFVHGGWHIDEGTTEFYCYSTRVRGKVVSQKTPHTLKEMVLLAGEIESLALKIAIFSRELEEGKHQEVEPPWTQGTPSPGPNS